MALEISKIKGIIWDLDNTLYRFTPDFKYECNIAAAKAALSLNVALSYEDALELAIQSEKEFGYSLHRYILDHDMVYADLHHPFHDNITTQHIDPIQDINEWVLNHNLHQVILTNASKGWANRALSHIGLNNFLPETHIIAMEDINFIPKARGAAGIEKALETLGLPAEHCVIVDDLERNLVHAADMNIQTAFIHYDEKLNDMPAYMDAQYEDAIAFLKDLKT